MNSYTTGPSKWPQLSSELSVGNAKTAVLGLLSKENNLKTDSPTSKNESSFASESVTSSREYAQIATQKPRKTFKSHKISLVTNYVHR